MVEGHEVGLIALQFRSHNSLVEVAAEVSKYAVIEVEEGLLRIAVVHPLLAGVVDILTGKLVLQFYCHHRNTIEREHHVDGVLHVVAIHKLAGTL